MGTVEDELHFMLECPLYGSERCTLLTALGCPVLGNNIDANMTLISNGSDAQQWRAIARYIGEGLRLRADRLQVKFGA